MHITVTKADIAIARTLRRDPLCMCAERAISALRRDLIWDAQIQAAPDGRHALILISPPSEHTTNGIVFAVPMPDDLVAQHTHWYMTGEMEPCDVEVKINLDEPCMRDAGTPAMGRG